MYETDPVLQAYQMQRLIGRRLQRELQEIADEKLPDDIADLLLRIDQRLPAIKQRPVRMH